MCWQGFYPRKPFSIEETFVTDELDNNLKDRLVATVRGAANAVPFVGGLIGELVTEVIPGQRQDRVVAYLRGLNEKLEALDYKVAKAMLQNPDKVDLIEAGGYQAARSTTNKRINNIVEVVFNGLKTSDSDTIRRKRLLGLLGEIDDDEFLLLNAYGQSYGNSGSDAWDKINVPGPIHMQSSPSDVESSKLYELGKERLLRLGVLEKNIRVKKGEIPEFDPKTGAIKGNSQISYLGRMLLREMGIALPFED